MGCTVTPGGHRNVTPEGMARLLAAWEGGTPVRDLAERFGRSTTWVRRAIAAAIAKRAQASA